MKLLKLSALSATLLSGQAAGAAVTYIMNIERDAWGHSGSFEYVAADFVGISDYIPMASGGHGKVVEASELSSCEAPRSPNGHAQSCVRALFGVELYDSYPWVTPLPYDFLGLLVSENGSSFSMSYFYFEDGAFSRVGTHASIVNGLRATLSVVETSVPEPATWAMMITGFGLVGGSLRSIRAPHKHATTRG